MNEYFKEGLDVQYNGRTDFNTTYIDGTGKYKKLINKKCKYAINYFQTGFFYKQVC